MDFVELYKTGLRTITVTGNNKFHLIQVSRNKKILYVVYHRDPFWVPYSSFFMLMILLIRLMYLPLFILLMTPPFFTRTPTLKTKLIS